MVVLHKMSGNAKLTKNPLVVTLKEEPTFVVEDSWAQEFYVA